MAHKVLYVDPWSGVSGDMLLAALLNIGGKRLEPLLHGLVASMGLGDAAVDVRVATEWGIACTRITVRAKQPAPLRRLEDMLEVIHRAEVSADTRIRATAAVRRLAEVEASVHACSVDEIHFHEVGGADTLVDVVGTFALVEALEVDKVFVGTIPVGGGVVESAHGRMGVPGPATVALLSGYEVVGGPEMKELTTPTGALLVEQLQAEQGMLPAMAIEAVGYGAGTMNLESGPNLLRVVLGESAAEAGGRRLDGAVGPGVVELQTNLDDVSPEVVGFTLRRLRDAGALEAWTVPAQMKKDRPGVVLHVLVQPEVEARIVDLVFAETGTLGIRRNVCGRHVAERGVLWVTVAGRPVGVKWGRWGGRMVSLAPEYEDAAAAAAAAGLPLREAMRAAGEAARSLLRDEHRGEEEGD